MLYGCKPGPLDDLMDYSLVHLVSKKLIEGKVFLKEATKSIGMKMSFKSLPMQSEQPYFQIHRKNEKTYIIYSAF